MAAKRIFKFLLKLAIAAGIVVGGFFGVKALIDSKNKHNLISSTSISLNVSDKVLNSATNLQNKSENYNTRVKIGVLSSINKVLVDYYNYYVSLSVFEEKPNDVERYKIVSKIQQLAQKADETKDSLRFIDSSANSTLKEQRIVFSANLYVEQTTLMFELDELLQKYVYEVNYAIDMDAVAEMAEIEGLEEYYMESTGIAYEAKLEMMKDYCKAVFNAHIVGKIDKPDELSGVLVNKDKETNFAKVLDKYFDRQSFDVNGDEEVHFSQFYMNMGKTQLNNFYKADDEGKSVFENSFSGETAKKYFNSLYKYLNRTSF